MKFGRFTKVAKSMVNELVQAEIEAEYQEAHTTSVSIKASVSTAAMLTVLSEMFGQSRYAFTGEIIEDFTADLFASLPDEMRRTAAEKADKITTELLAKQGITITSGGPAGNGINEDQTWRGLACADFSYIRNEAA